MGPWGIKSYWVNCSSPPTHTTDLLIILQFIKVGFVSLDLVYLYTGLVEDQWKFFAKILLYLIFVCLDHFYGFLWELEHKLSKIFECFQLSSAIIKKFYFDIDRVVCVLVCMHCIYFVVFECSVFMWMFSLFKSF